MNVMLALVLGICIGMWAPPLLARLLTLREPREPDYPVKGRMKLNDLLDERPNTVASPEPPARSGRHRLAADERP